MFACCSSAEVESYATQSLSGTIYRVKLRVAGDLWQVGDLEIYANLLAGSGALI